MENTTNCHCHCHIDNQSCQSLVICMIANSFVEITDLKLAALLVSNLNTYMYMI